VLVEADDMNDPIADATRSILDGHVVLTRELATQNHYPAVDVLEKRQPAQPGFAPAGATRPHRRRARASRGVPEEPGFDQHRRVSGGQQSAIDQAIALHEPLNRFLRQGVTEGFCRRAKLVVADKKPFRSRLRPGNPHPLTNNCIL